MYVFIIRIISSYFITVRYSILYVLCVLILSSTVLFTIDHGALLQCLMLSDSGSMVTEVA